MADMQVALLRRILASAPVQGMAGARVHWLTIPQTVVRPNVRLQTIDGTREQHLKGYSGRREARVQADSYAPTYEEARALSEVVIAAIINPAIESGVTFNRAEHGEPFDFAETINGVTVPRVSVDLTIHYSV